MTGVQLPDRELDGTDLAAILASESAPSPHAQLNWVYGNSWVISEVHWKILGDAKGDSLALYDLNKDPAEQHNVAAENREITSYLIGRHNEWIRKVMQDANANGYNDG